MLGEHAQPFAGGAQVERGLHLARLDECILDIVDERAPDGFDDLEAVLPARELEAIVLEYKTLAGHQVAFAANGEAAR